MTRRLSILLWLVGSSFARGDSSVSAPPAPPTSTAILLGLAEGLLIPLLCWDGRAARFTTGEACRALIPAGAELEHAGGALTILGPAMSRCGALETPALAAGFSVQRPAKRTTRGIAIWPSPQAARLRGSPRAPSTALVGDERRLIDAALGARAADVDEEPSVLEPDLDGDGRPDRLLWVRRSGHWGGRHQSYQQGALFVHWAGERKLVPLDRRPCTFSSFETLVDLDGDGRPELYYSTHDTCGGARQEHVLVHFRAREPETLLRWDPCARRD